MGTRTTIQPLLGQGGRFNAGSRRELYTHLSEVYADLTTLEAAWALIGGPLATTAALSAVTTAVDGRLYYVTAVGIYYYDAASVATVDSPRVLAATGMAGVGRYIAVAEEADVHARIHVQVADLAALAAMTDAVDGQFVYVSAAGPYVYSSGFPGPADSPRIVEATAMPAGYFLKLEPSMSRHAVIHDSVATIAAMEALTDAIDGQIVGIQAAGDVYQYQAAAVGPTDSPRCIPATGMAVGFWLQLDLGSTRHAAIHSSVATTAAMQALTNLVDGCLVNTLDHGLYRYDAASVGPANGFLVMEATGMGPAGFMIQLAESGTEWAKNAGTYADLVALAAVTNAVDGQIFYVTNIGLYRYDGASVLAVDSPYVVDAGGMGAGRYLMLLDAYRVRPLVPFTTDHFVTTDAAAGVHDAPLYIDLDMGDGSRCGVLNATIPSAADINPAAAGTDSVRVVHAAAPTGVQIFSDGATGWRATLPTGRDAYFISAEGKKYPVLFDVAPPANPVEANDDVVKHFTCNVGTGDFNETSVLVP